MKKILLLLLCVLVVCLTNAQSGFGIINYTLPEGWYDRQAGNDIELVKKGAENSGCKITLFQQVNTVVDGEKKYAELWALKTTNNFKIQKKTTPVKTEDEEWISFSGSKTNGKNTEGFYTLSDGNKTAMMLATSPDNTCADELDIILASINISSKESGPKTKTKAKAKSKKVRVLPLKSLKALVN
jgi:hypothetical protein